MGPPEGARPARTGVMRRAEAARAHVGRGPLRASARRGWAGARRQPARWHAAAGLRSDTRVQARDRRSCASGRGRSLLRRRRGPRRRGCGPQRPRAGDRGKLAQGVGVVGGRGTDWVGVRGKHRLRHSKRGRGQSGDATERPRIPEPPGISARAALTAAPDAFAEGRTRAQRSPGRARRSTSGRRQGRRRKYRPGRAMPLGCWVARTAVVIHRLDLLDTGRRRLTGALSEAASKRPRAHPRGTRSVRARRRIDRPEVLRSTGPAVGRKAQNTTKAGRPSSSSRVPGEWRGNENPTAWTFADVPGRAVAGVAF